MLVLLYSWVNLIVECWVFSQSNSSFSSSSVHLKMQKMSSMYLFQIVCCKGEWASRFLSRWSINKFA